MLKFLSSLTMYNFSRSMKFWNYFAIAMVFMLASCNDDDAINDFPNGTGITGRVGVQNEFQQPLYDERNGITVDLEVGFQSFSVQADNVGIYRLGGAPLGLYQVTFSKEGYSTVTVRNWQVSNTQPVFPIEDGFQKFPTVTITRLPSTVFDNFTLDLSAVQVGASTIYDLVVGATLVPGPPPTGQSKGYRLFFGTDADVSPENYIFQEFGTTLSPNITLNYDNSWFQSLALSAGDLIYVAIYGDANFDQMIENPDGTVDFPNLTLEAGGAASAVLP